MNFSEIISSDNKQIQEYYAELKLYYIEYCEIK